MAETIVMIHGMWGGHWDWEKYKSFFQERGYDCVTPTLRYHEVAPGSVPDPRLGNTSLLDYAEDLHKVVSRLDSPPILMGHSMGGLLAQIVGSRVNAKAIVLLTPAAPAGIFSIRPTVFKTFFRLMTTWGFWRKPMRLTFDEAKYAILNLVPQEEQTELYNKAVHESGKAAFEIGFWLLDPGRAAYVDESKVTCPMLVVGASQDRITPVAVIRQVAKKYRKVADYSEFPNHAHWVLGEPGWQDVAQFVAEWLASSLSDRAGPGSLAASGS